MNTNSGTQALAVEQELTAAEREQGQLLLKQTKSGLLGAIKGLSDEQWRFVGAAGQWSIGQIVEHVVFVLERVGGPMRELLAQASAPPADRDYRYVDGIVIHHFPSRLIKFTAPDSAVPGERFGSAPESIGAIVKSYCALEEFLEQTADLRGHALEAAPLKAVTKGAYDQLDGYQWILAAAAHAERHTKQILEVKADESFPVN